MISNNGHDENGKYNSGKAGDQTGNEWHICNWYNFGQKCILRHPDEKVRELIAVQAEKAAKNDNCGYDQWNRLSYESALIAADDDPAKIKIACESDCSSGICANVRSVGRILKDAKLSTIKNNLVTQGMRAAFKKAGFEVITDPKFLSSDAYLLRGDIILNDDKHVCTNLTNGAKIQNDAPLKPIDDIVAEVIAGKWGNGAVRKNKLNAAGYNYDEIQALVNAKLGTTKKSSTPSVTKYQVINVNSFLRIRSEGSTNGAIIGKLSNGTKIDVIEVSNGWAKLASGGWVSTSYIARL